MTDLPEPDWFVPHLKEGAHLHEAKKYVNSGMFHGLYTANQMREYRNQALEEAAKVCEVQVQMINVNGQNGRYKECAAAIRTLKEQK